jgi:F-type H+-transporting ATPase subunit b
MMRPARLSRSIAARAIALSVATASFLISAGPALAQEAGTSYADSSTGWIFRWLNFAIVVGLLVYAFRKAAPAFRRNSEEISRKIAEGARAREAAEAQRRDVQAKMAGIDAEVAAMREDAKRGTQAEAERIRALAKSDAEAIERAARAEVAAAERAARLELRSAAARLAVQRAETILREQLTAGDEATLFRAFVGELERSSN